jgi:hypothetical protein
MKKSSQHAFEPEEVMAYLDGELPAAEAAVLASHLERCGECQALAAQLRQVSERMLDFQVEPCPAKVAESVLKAADEERNEPPAKPVFEWRPRRRRTLRVLAWAGGFAVLFLAAALLLIPNMPELESRRSAIAPAHPPSRPSAAMDKISPFPVWNKLQAPPSNGPVAPAARSMAKLAEPEGIVGGVPGGAGVAGGVALAGRDVGPVELKAKEESETRGVQAPMVVQTASIMILASNYDQASKTIQQITAHHGGYVQDLNAETPTGAARSLSATLRVPEKQLEACLADLRKLGHVEQEWRNNQEITSRYIDVIARLRNSRAEEQRILELLKTQTGRLSDVLEAERELARVRGDIESMEGQRAYMEHQVSHATVQVQLNEEYRAQLNPEAFSTGTRIRNSLVEGFRNLGDGAVSMVMFVFAYGPSILFWLVLISVPTWFAWRRFRRGRTPGDGQ